MLDSSTFVENGRAIAKHRRDRRAARSSCHSRKVQKIIVGHASSKSIREKTIF
ncbi:hypothetical protein [Microcoleus sp. herbarium14]|uniref:hypothetical protein n=1 Tax=Microcoleus sp. herbarium14 TaxID=3055439 RepID=UPI002FD28D9D